MACDGVSRKGVVEGGMGSTAGGTAHQSFETGGSGTRGGMVSSLSPSVGEGDGIGEGCGASQM